MNFKNWFTKSVPPMEIKSLPGTQETLGQSFLTRENKIILSNSPVDLMALNTGYAKICTDRLAHFLSSINLHLYAEAPVEGTRGLVIPHRSVSKRLKQFNVKNIKRSGSEIIEIEDHPVKNLLQMPAPGVTTNDLMSIITSYLSIIGNCYIEIVKENDVIVALNPLYSEYMYVDINESGKITQYRYCPTNSTSRIYTPDQILHLKLTSAGNIVGGRGFLESCLREAALHRDILDYNISLSNNSGVPTGIINIAGKPASEEDARKIKTKFLQNFGRLNKGNPMVSFTGVDGKPAPGSVDFKPIGQVTKDLEQAKMLDECRRVICAAFHVPLDLITSENSNRASSVVAINNFMKFSIFPILNIILEQLNNGVIKQFDESLFLSYDPMEALEQDSETQARVLNSYVASGVLTRDEVREILDFNPLEESQG